MATPKAGYYAKDGKRLPSVTTILGRFKQADGLIGWAHKMGLKGLDYRGVGDDEAAVGTAVHSYAEGNVPDVSHFSEEHQASYANATSAVDKWRASTRIQIRMREVALISEELRVGGTLDAEGWDPVDEEDEIIDYKTSKRIYADSIVQVAAYRALWNECKPYPIRRARIVRFCKQTGEFEELLLDEAALDEGFALFKLYRQAYDLSRQLEKRVK